MRPKLLLIITFFLIAGNLYAQQNYKPSLLVGNNGDTLKGFIDYHNWEYSPSSFEFKSAMGAAAKTYRIADCKYFEIIGLDKYERFDITRLTAPAWAMSEWNQLDTTIADQVFLRLIVDGSKVSLYEYNELYRLHLYIKTPAGNPEELIFKEFIDTVDTYSIITKNNYRVQLMPFTNYNKKLIRMVNNSEFRLSSLRPVIKSLNGLVTGYYNKDYYGTYAKRRVRYFAGAGITQTGLRYEEKKRIGFTATNLQITKSDFDTEAKPLLAIGVDVLQSRQQQAVFFRAEIQSGYFSFYNESMETDIITGNNFKNSYSVKQVVLLPSINANFNLTRNENYNLYLGVGALYGFLFFPKSEVVSRNLTTGKDSTYKYNFAKGNAALKFNFGATYKKLDASLSVYTNLEHANTFTFKSQQQLITFRLAYFIQ